MKTPFFSLCLFFVFFFTGLYTEQEAPKKSLVIVTYQVAGAQPWDPKSIESGITGSEEAVIYVSQKLVDLGYKVTVLGNPPANSPYSAETANPRFVHTSFNDGTTYDIALSWRMPTAAKKLKKYATKVYLWPHDTYHWPVAATDINAFEDVLWLSKYQREQWMEVNPGFAKFTHIFGNGVNLDQFEPVQERSNPYGCIYGSNYGRGLDVLLDIWPMVKVQYPQATLDIYYGWQHWGLLTPQQEAKMRAQIAKLEPLGVKEHGLVSHKELNKAYAKASFWTYPCNCPEVFCITAIRAQLAGAMPVIVQGSCLKETVRAGYVADKKEDYLKTLLQAMENAEKITVADRQKLGDFVRKEYTWEKVVSNWDKIFNRD